MTKILVLEDEASIRSFILVNLKLLRLPAEKKRWKNWMAR